MIAMALALEPKLMIADEPTTALDVTIQAQVLELISRLTTETGTSLILITHDLGVVAGMTDRINVMYAGFIVETATTGDLFERAVAPVHGGPAALDAPGRRSRGRAADPDRGPAAGHAQRPDRLPVRAPLRVAARRVLDRQPGARAGRAGHGRRDDRRARDAPDRVPQPADAGGGGRTATPARPGHVPAPPPAGQLDELASYAALADGAITAEHLADLAEAGTHHAEERDQEHEHEHSHEHHEHHGTRDEA